VHHFWYKEDRLYCEDVPVAEVARKVGTPFYLYSQSTLERHFRVFDGAFSAVPHLTCFAVKANSNLAVLALFRRLGSGFDIVSGGELQKVLRVGADPQKVVYSGVGKTEAEVDLALENRILQFNVESAAELRLIEARARSLRKVACIGLRVNPDVDAKTHPYIATGLQQNKFGIPIETAPELVRRIARSKNLKLTGLGFHIGSQITRIDPFVEALSRLKEMVLKLRKDGQKIDHVDLGGGLGITYNDEIPPPPEDYGKAVLEVLKDLKCTVLLEPGRVIAGNAGILVTRVVITKQTPGKNFVVVDAGMNDLLRPSLYGSYHGIQPETLAQRRRWKADVVGPICESSDFLARDRDMPVVKAKDLLAVMSAGAYGFVLSSNYNARPRIPEVLVRGRRFKVVRRRETFRDLIHGESQTPL
jgi:diaminopimelate decarboxylase